MKRMLLVLVLLLTGADAIATRSQQTPPAAAGNHVVIISLDGFAGWAMDDPYLPVPTLRRLAAQGAVAKKGMVPVNPTVTWPNHTSMITGVTPAKHGVLFNGVLIREPGVPPRVEPWRDRNEMVRVRTVYDEAHAQGMTTAQVDWVAIQNAPTITWEFPERPNPKGQIEVELVKAGVISQSDLESFHTRNIAWRDHIWTLAAAHILRQHRPNLLMFHLLSLDSAQHRYGPRTAAALNTMALLDAQVGAIVRTLEETGLASRTTLFVVSDHGFKLVKRHIRPNAAFLKAGLLKTTENKITEAQAYSYPEGGTALAYITVPDPAGAVLKRMKDALEGIEGIEAIVEPPDFPRHGLPQPADNSQMGALFLIAKDGYAFSGDAGDQVVVDAPATSLGSHGYVATDPDLRALFIASGRGIKPGTILESVRVVDLAPTVASLLGLGLKNVEGEVLTQMLSPATPQGPSRHEPVTASGQR